MNSSSIRLTLLGTGSSGGVPRIGNDWGKCDSKNPRNRRRRCACLIQRCESWSTSDTLARSGDNTAGDNTAADSSHPATHSSDSNLPVGPVTSVLIDTGPDMREQLLSADIKDLQAVLLTHSHADHIAGIDDLRQLWVTHKRSMDVYMDELTSQRVMDAFSYCFMQPEGSSYPPFCHSRQLVADVALSVEGPGGPIELLPVQVEHGDIHALGFRVDGMAYIPDVKTVNQEKSLERLQGLDTLVIDALRRQPHPTHMSLDDALSFIDLVAPRRAILTNLHSDMDYATLVSELPAHVEPGFDGMTIPIQSS